jgi:hypothetical protein
MLGLTMHQHTRPIVIASTILLAGAACASIQNTEAQNLAESRLQACTRLGATIRVTSVAPNGQIRFYYAAASDRAQMLECLGNASRQGPPLPEPLTEPLPRGS